MRTRKELQETLEKIHGVIYDDAVTDESWLPYILGIYKMSDMGARYVSGIMTAHRWAIGEEWDFVETPGMIEGFRDYRSP